MTSAQATATPVPRPGPCRALIVDLDRTSGRVGKGARKCSGDSLLCLFVLYVEEDVEKLVGSLGLLGPDLFALTCTGNTRMLP